MAAPRNFERGQGSADQPPGPPSNRLSSSLLEPKDNTVADIWRVFVKVTFDVKMFLEFFVDDE